MIVLHSESSSFFAEQVIDLEIVASREGFVSEEIYLVVLFQVS